MNKLFAGAFLLLLTVPALAQTPSYNFVTGSWQRVDLDDGGLGLDIDGDGIAIGGSYEFAPNWHGSLAYGTLDFGSGVDLNVLTAAFGYHTDISNITSFYTEALLLRAEVDTPFGSVDDDGYGLAIGVRSNIQRNIELEGRLEYTDSDDSDGGIGVGAAGWYLFDNDFAVGLSASFDDDVTGFGIGVRYTF